MLALDLGADLASHLARWGREPVAVLAYLLLAAVTVPLVRVDLREHRLPNAITYRLLPALTVLLATQALLSGTPDRLGRALLAGLVLLLAYGIPALVLGGAGIGMGDAKLAPSLGLALGWLTWGHVLRGTVYAFLLAGLVALALVASRRLGRKDHLAFGPFLLAGAWLAILLT